MRHPHHHHDHPGHGRWSPEIERRWNARVPPHLRARLPEWMWLRFRISAHLQRRIFWWFILTILATGAAVFSLFFVLGRDSGWVREEERLRAFVGDQFADNWNDPARRDALATNLARDLDVDVVLQTPDGAKIAVFGADSCNHRWYVAPVVEGSHHLGNAKICLDRHAAFSHWKLVAAFFVVLFVLSIMSGRVARRLGRPLSELARVAKDLGEGRLSSRYQLGCNEPGEIGIVAESVNEMAARIERQLSDQRELMAGVSHELRTPLARIRLLIELIRDIEGGGGRLDEIEREVMEIDALVGELLASARLDFAAIVRRPIDAADAARRALERSGLAPTLARIDAVDTAFEADPSLVARALANLVENAKRHAGGLEALVVSLEGDELVFAAEDRGPGFPPDGEGHVFVPFAPRADGRPREAGSLGLGLALVKRIAEAHGGRAFAENREGGGARVGLRLPVRAPVVSA